jgi:hypothetical protein
MSRLDIEDTVDKSGGCPSTSATVSEMPERKRRRKEAYLREDEADGASATAGFVFGGMWLALLLGSFLVRSDWAGYHGILLGWVAALMLCFRPSVAVPKSWWCLGAAFALAGAACFLPAQWFHYPEWRIHLEKLGLNTGSLVVIQQQMAVEKFGVFVITVLVGLWLAGFRATSHQLRVWALAFTMGVACYAVLSKVMLDRSLTGPLRGDEHYGFFPNRNHTATYLTMGGLCGLGCVLQALRDKRFVWMFMALGATAVCLWALVGLSVSRAGVVLLMVGCVAWLPLVGLRHLGKHGTKLVGLLVLTAIGFFLVTDSEVKNRIFSTAEATKSALAPVGADSPENPVGNGVLQLDFRIPTALDTWELIKDFKWTGVGAGQYLYVFPQYRELASVHNDADSLHPESDWLWLAAETGIPATLAIAALVILATWKSVRSIRRGRDRTLRAACLVAAWVVPFHGLVDVPGHLITLALSSVLLYTLSLSWSEAPRTPAIWPFRVASVALTVGSIFALYWGGMMGWKHASGMSAKTLTEARRLYQEDRELQKAAAAQGTPYQPSASEDRLEQAIALLSAERKVLPLDRAALRYQCYLAFHFDDKFERIERDFLLEQALDPFWIGAPMRQAEAWARVDPNRAIPLWNLALKRAARLDQIQPGTPFSREATLAKIRQFGRMNKAALPAVSELE